MRVVVVGVGAMGAGIAQGLTAAGSQVVLTFSRDPDRPAAVAARVGHGCLALAPSEAVAGADAVIVTVAPEGIDPAVAALGDLSGVVVVCVTSGLGLDPTGGTYGLPTSRAGSMAHHLAAAAPRARVVQTLSTTFAAVFATGAADLPERPTVPLCGDDPDAKAVAGRLVTQLGAEPLDIGGLAVAPALETFATASAQLAIASGLAPQFAVRLLRGRG